MKYALLLYADENEYPAPDSDELHAEMQEWHAYTEALTAAGVNLGGEALLPTPTASTLDRSGGRTVTRDGPFAETKEALGGFYLIDVPDLDAAIAWAEKVPTDYISVEIRPLMVLDDA